MKWPSEVLRVVLDETDEVRFQRVAAIFDAATFLQTLRTRLEAVGPSWCPTLTVMDEGPPAPAS
jgi:hypothetical protein